LICQDGATASDDFTPYAADGLNATCADLIEEIKVFGDGSEECGWLGFKDIKSACCPTTPPENPCMVCPDGITATDDFAPYADWGDNTTCNELVELGYFKPCKVSLYRPISIFCPQFASTHIVIFDTFYLTNDLV